MKNLSSKLILVIFTAFAICATAAAARADRLRLVDGTTVEVDEAWEDAQGVWYRRGSVTHLIDRARVRKVEKISRAEPAHESKPEAEARVETAPGPSPQPVWIYLEGGARVEADEITESGDGVWYRRGRITVFLDRWRIARIEREQTEGKTPAAAARRAQGWSTGSARIDAHIRENGARFGVDPYLIYLVIEQESRFRTRAVSPRGAQGLMQLMPGTARRFGVRRPFDPAQNVMGGTRYLKELLAMFNGRVDLALASYNAGEGAVMKYGRNVPPYRETRNYVRRISARYEATNGGQ
jgi:soluble lytic murein transglycosylase-like protein